MPPKKVIPGYIHLADNSIIYDVHSPCILEASAGSGKTTVLVERFIVSLIYELLTSRLHPREVLSSMVAITFTRKAALEMRERIRSRIEKYFFTPYLTAIIRTLQEYYPDLRQDPVSVQCESILTLKEDLLQSLSYASVSTIHAFAFKLLKSHPVESGLDPGMHPQDDQGIEQLSLSSQDAMMLSLSHLIEKKDPSVSILIRCLGFKKFSKHLEQIFALCREKGWKYWCESIQQSHYDRYFNEEKSKDEQSIFELFGKELRPLLENVLGLVRQHNQIAKRNAAVYTQLEQDLVHILELPPSEMFRFDLKPSFPKKEVQDEEQRLLREKISLSFPELHLRIHQLLLPAFHSVMEYTWNQYRLMQQERHELSFADIEWKLIELLKKDESFTRSILKSIKYLMMDEYQDTSRSQKELFSTFLDPRLAIHISPFIVGDPKQSIYGFRSAEVQVFSETQEMFRRSYGSDSVKNLEYNYRSQADLVSDINTLFSEIFKPGSGLEYQPQASPQTQEKSYPRGGTYYLPCPEEKAEDIARSSAQDAALLIKRLIGQQGFRARDFMVLLRKRTHANLINQVLKKELPDLPMVNVDTSNILEQDEVLTLLHYLRALDDPLDDYRMLALMKSPFFRMEDSQIFRICRLRGGKGRIFEEIRKSGDEGAKIFCSIYRDKKHWDIPGLLEEIVHRTGYYAYLNALPHNREATSNLILFIQQLRSIQESEMFNLTEFLYFIDNGGLDLNQAQIVGENANVMRIMTIHAAKGLQAPVVIYISSGKQNRSTDILDLEGKLGFNIIGSDRNHESIRMQWQERESEEDKRLFYVAVTRAAYRFYYLGYQENGKDSWSHFVTPFIDKAAQTVFKNAGDSLNSQRGLPFQVEPGRAINRQLDWNTILSQAIRVSTPNCEPGVFTITQILDMEFDPASFINKYIIRSYPVEESFNKMVDEESPLSGMGDSRADLGTFLHQVLQWSDKDNFREVCEQLIRTSAPDLISSQDTIITMLQKYYSSAVYKQIEQCGSVHKEYEFLYPMTTSDGDIFIKGIIDVLARGAEGKNIILDYKLKIKDSQLERYSRQLQYYSLILESMGIGAGSLYLFDLESGQAYSVQYDMQKVKQALTIQMHSMREQFKELSQ